MASQEALREYYRGLIAEHGYASVQFGMGTSDLDSLFGQFKDFLSLCDEPDGQPFKDALTNVPPSGTRTIGGDYFVTRRQIGQVNPFSLNPSPATEDKDVAHIGPSSLALAEQRLPGGLPRVMRQFLNSCVELHETAKTASIPVLGALGLKEAILSPGPLNDQHVVRLLRYLGKAPLLADLHFDRSVVTLAAWESHPGLVGSPSDNGHGKSIDITTLDADAERALSTAINHYPGHAKFFLGAGQRRLPADIAGPSDGLPLLLHGVTNENPNEERYAAVVFMHPLAHYPGYVVPGPDETGIDGVRNFILRHGAVQEDVA